MYKRNYDWLVIVHGFIHIQRKWKKNTFLFLTLDKQIYFMYSNVPLCAAYMDKQGKDIFNHYPEI